MGLGFQEESLRTIGDLHLYTSIVIESLALASLLLGLLGRLLSYRCRVDFVSEVDSSDRTLLVKSTS